MLYNAQRLRNRGGAGRGGSVRSASTHLSDDYIPLTGLYDPAGHSVHSSLPSAAKVPAGQDRHSLLPFTGALVPAGQVLQEVEPGVV